jgi:uncharacterized membrane protein
VRDPAETTAVVCVVPCAGHLETMSQPKVQARERILSVRRAVTSLGIGVFVGALAATFGAPELFLLASWTVATSVVVAWVWRISWPLGPEGTERLAEEENRSHSTDTGVLIAAVASLGAVVSALIRSSSHQDAVAVALVILSVLTVILSWALVNTVFALKYARLYHLDENGGIDFKQDQPPAYSDFAYMAFTIGMSYAVSENEPTSTRIRKSALGHALLSYMFGTGILAVAINLVTNRGQSS